LSFVSKNVVSLQRFFIAQSKFICRQKKEDKKKKMKIRVRNNGFSGSRLGLRGLLDTYFQRRT
jgi:hypothetical protein